jgi:predicted DNA-binding transcriptional regulator YafY
LEIRVLTDAGPTARALLALELIQNHPGINADRLAERLGVSERAARRYVATLREAEIPIESTRGPYGGYRVGRGLRLPPLMFTASEALGLVMAVVEGPHGTGGTDADDDPVVGALGKIIRVLPETVAAAADTVRRGSVRRSRRVAVPDPDVTAALIRAGQAGRRTRLTYRRGTRPDLEMVVDPWAVVIRHGLWYLLCWSHSAGARRVLRADRVTAVDALDEPFEPPADLDPIDEVEAHLSEGWRHAVEVVVEAPAEDVARWVPRSRGALESLGPDRTLLTGTTNEPEWYAEQLALVDAPYRVVGSPVIRAAVERLARRMLDALEPDETFY